ncbi:MAG: hypothetical protein ACP5MH_08920 [Thermoproteus sp.]
MCRRLEDREVEVLRAALASNRFYHVYKSTSIPLATAWRILRRFAERGYVEYHNGRVRITEAGLILLALHDDVALRILARKYGVSADVMREYLELVCRRLGEADLPVRSLADTIGLVGVGALRELRGTPVEGLAVDMLLQFCRDCIVEVDGSAFILGSEGIVAARCKLCGDECKRLYPECPHAKVFFRSLKTRFLRGAKNNRNADKKT